MLDDHSLTDPDHTLFFHLDNLDVRSLHIDQDQKINLIEPDSGSTSVHW